MFFFAARIGSDCGSGLPDLQGAPGKGRESNNFRIWEFPHPREAATEGKKPSDGRAGDYLRGAGFDLQAQGNAAEGSEWRKSKSMNKDAVAKQCGFEFFAKEEEVK